MRSLSPSTGRSGRLESPRHCNWLVLSIVLLASCAVPTHRSYTVEEFDTQPELFADRYIDIQLAPNTEIGLVLLDSIPETVSRLIPDATANGYVFLIQSSSDSTCFVRSRTTMNSTGGEIYTLGGEFNPTTETFAPSYWYMAPMKFTNVHDRESKILARTVIPVGDDFVCYVPAREKLRFGPTYFCRNDYANLLRFEDWYVFPGYSVIGDGFWVVVPREHVASMLLAIDPSTEEGIHMEGGEELSDPYVPERWAADGSGNCDELEVRYAEASAEPDDLTTPSTLIAKWHAPQFALCRASEGDDEAALDALRDGIDAHNKDAYGSYTRLFEHYEVGLLIHVARGESGEAAGCAAILLHMTRPTWRFPPEFEADIGSEDTPLRRFLDSRGEEIRRNWPAFVDTLYASAPSGGFS